MATRSYPPRSFPPQSSEPQRRRRPMAPAHQARPVGEHPLGATWTIWHSMKGGFPQNVKLYRKKMELKYTCGSVEHLNECISEKEATPSEMPQGFTLHLFRKDSRNRKPCWERYPKGGSWSMSIPVESELVNSVDKMWKKLINATVSEFFSDTRMVGVTVGRRKGHINISVWHRNYTTDLDIEEFGKKTKEVLGLTDDDKVDMLFKPFSAALKDGSERWSGNHSQTSSSDHEDSGVESTSPQSSPEASPVVARKFTPQHSHLSAVEDAMSGVKIVRRAPSFDASSMQQRNYSSMFGAWRTGAAVGEGRSKTAK